MDTQDVIRRILLQRMARFADAGPSLASAGTARYRMEPTRVRVAYATLLPHMAPVAVQTVLRFARARRRTVQWLTIPDRAGEEGLAEALASQGFQLTESLLLMAHEGQIPVLPSREISVERIRDWQHMWEYERGSRLCFYQESTPAEGLVTARAADRWQEQERGWCDYYRAVMNSRMIGGCYVSRYEDIPTIMGVYTLPEVRNQGVATQLLARTVRDVVTSQNTLTCLFVEHGNPAERLYRSLGFIALQDWQTYTWGDHDNEAK